MLHRLAYISTFIGDATQRDLDEILQTARRRKSADGITGLLVFHEGNFFQVLEGPREEVLACYARILRDTRHRECVTLLSGPVQSREFADWEMAYIPFAALGPTDQQDFINLQELGRSDAIGSLGKDSETKRVVTSFLSCFGSLSCV